MRKFYFSILVILLGFTLCPSWISASSTYHVYTISLSGSAPYYFPSMAQVPAGLPIQWVNTTPSPHTITHDGCRENAPCAFDSGGLKGNAVFSVYRLKPGNYPYHCRLHPIMRGTLIVLAAANRTGPENQASTDIGVQ